MKLTERATPETDAARLHGGWLVRADDMAGIEKRLGAALDREAMAVKALNSALGVGYDDNGWQDLARETLTAIKEAT